MSKKRLGRGLDSLLSQPGRVAAPAPETVGDSAMQAQSHPAQASAITQIDVTEVHPSPYQPRRQFSEQSLAELAESLKTQGFLQPIVVRPRPQGGYELIAGERRWRAAMRGAIERVPALIRRVSDREASALALIENMQREDLNALEEALGLARLRDEFELTQQQIADLVGKSRVAIANLLRLVNLGATARDLLERGEIEMGHARALLGLDGLAQDQAARQIAQQGLSVRQAEALVKSASAGPGQGPNKARASANADIARLEQRITDRIGAPVSIKHASSGKGELRIRYSSLDELQGVLRHLGVDD